MVRAPLLLARTTVLCRAQSLDVGWASVYGQWQGQVREQVWGQVQEQVWSQVQERQEEGQEKGQEQAVSE